MIAWNIFASFSNSERQSWSMEMARKNFAKTSYFHTTYFFSFPYLSPCYIRSETKKDENQGSVKNEGERWNCETAFRNEEGTLDCDIKKYKNIILFLAILIFYTARVFSLDMEGIFLVCRGRNKNKFHKNMAYLFGIRKKAKKSEARVIIPTQVFSI